MIKLFILPLNVHMLKQNVVVTINEKENLPYHGLLGFNDTNFRTSF